MSSMSDVRHMGAVVGKNKTGPIPQWIVDVPEKLDLFHDKYFPPVERSEKSEMCVTRQVHSNLFHPSIAQPPHMHLLLFPNLFLHFFSALTPFTPGHVDLSSPPSATTWSPEIGKSWSCSTTTVGLVGWWVVHGWRWCEELRLVGSGRAPNTQAAPAFHWENSSSPSNPPSQSISNCINQNQQDAALYSYL